MTMRRTGSTDSGNQRENVAAESVFVCGMFGYPLQVAQVNQVVAGAGKSSVTGMEQGTAVGWAKQGGTAG